MKRFIVILLSVFFFMVRGHARDGGQERIESFHSRITVQTNGVLLVEETVTVFATGDQIRRGIYRDFPTRYKDKYGLDYEVGFNLIGAYRDGKPEPHRTESTGNGIRIYLGREDYFLPNYKSYTYRIVYKTSGQLFFESNYTELYWNVTGNDWAFPIDRAWADVILPGNAAGRTIFLNNLVGPKGSTERGAPGRPDKNGIRFEAGRRLSSGEGMTVVVRFPKGVVSEPPREELAARLIRGYRAELAGMIGLGIVLLYYFISWLAVGRDPRKGTIMPLYEPPDKLSPAAVRYIRKMGYDNQAFSANIVDMAVKGYLRIEEDKGGEFSIRRTDGSETALTPDERRVGDDLLGKTATFAFRQSNHSKIAFAIALLKNWLKNEFQKKYFVNNRGFFAFGAVLTAVALVVSFLSSGKPEGMFLMVWLTFWTFGTVPLVIMVVRSWGQAAAGRGLKKISGAGGALFFTLFSIPFVGAEIFVSAFYISQFGPSLFILVFLMILLNFVFYRLLKAPTKAGRAVMDKIEGLRMFLSATEKDRLARMISMDQTMVNYEKFLPYAIALDVEDKWSEKFKATIERAQAANASPSWYGGSAWSRMGAAGFGRALGSTFAGAIGASSASPSRGGSSGSGGGGGSSGGGGGGGGGGGW